MARFVVCLLLLLAWAPGSDARELAPLPRGFEAPRASQPPLRGLYAHAIARSSADEALGNATLDCRARGGVEVIGDRSAIGMTEIWVYRTETQIVRYAEQGRVEVDATSCTATVTRWRAVARRLVIDGRIFRVRPPRDEASDRQWTIEAVADSVHGWPNPLSGGVLRSERCGEQRPYHTCTIARLQGVHAKCEMDTATFNLSSYCVSISRGLSEGLLLYSLTDSGDVGQSHQFEIDALNERAELDPGLFAFSNAWAGSQVEVSDGTPHADIE